MTEMQRQFEEWALSEGIAVGFGDFISGQYNSDLAERYWEIWQASRAAIVVKLPELKSFGWFSQETIEGYKTAIGEVKHALDDAEVNYE